MLKVQRQLPQDAQTMSANLERGVPCHCDIGHRGFVEQSRSLEGKSVAFVHPRRMRDWGSVILRQVQLAEMLQAYDPKIVARSATLEELRSPVDAAILSKTVGMLPFRQIVKRKLRRKAGKLIFDLVDGHLSLAEKYSDEIDRYMCSSASEFKYRRLRQERAWLVHHHVDLRIKQQNTAHSEFRLGYAGGRRNAVHLDGLKIEVYDTEDRAPSDNLVSFQSFIGSVSHHYSVRNYNNQDGFKPGLKIFLASHVGGVLIGSRSDLESLILLGPNYPYLAQNSSPEAVGAIINYARETFGTAVHSSAVAQLRALRPLFCPARVVGDVHALLRAEVGAST